MSVGIEHLASGRLFKRILGNMNGSHSPGFAIITGRHVSSDTFTLCHSVDIIGVSSVQDNLGVSPRYTGVEDALASSLKMPSIPIYQKAYSESQQFRSCLQHTLPSCPNPGLCCHW